MRVLVRIVCLAAVAAALIVPATAHAAPPPAGKYWCTLPFSSNRTFGQITVVSSSTYRWHSGASGRYSTVGRTIRFTSGPLRGLFVHNRWRVASGVTMIEMYDGSEFGRSYQDVRCIKRRG